MPKPPEPDADERAFWDWFEGRTTDPPREAMARLIEASPEEALAGLGIAAALAELLANPQALTSMAESIADGFSADIRALSELPRQDPPAD